MQKFVQWIVRFRWPIVLGIPLAVFLLASQLRYLEFEGSYRIWFGEGSPTLQAYDNFRRVFGSDRAVTIAFRDEQGIFNPEALGVIERITAKLWQTRYIGRVDSLTNYQYVHSDAEYPDEVIVEDFMADAATLGPKALAQKKKIALGEDLLVGRLLSGDAKTAMIVGRITPKAGEDPQVSLRLKALVEAIVAPEAEAHGYRFYLNGGPIVNASFVTVAEHDAALFTPLVVLAVMGLLWIVFRRFPMMLISISVVIFTFASVLSVQILLGYKLNNFTANMPVFVIAIGIADAMHLMLVYLLARRRGMANIEALQTSLHKNFLPILLTSLTTAVGFASLGVSHVVPIKTLGVATANAALLAFALTVLFIPALLAVLNPKVKPLTDPEAAKADYGPLALRYGAWIVRNAKPVLLIGVLLFLALGIGLGKVRVDSNTVRYFSEEVPFRQAVNFMQANLSGPMSYEIVVDSGAKDGIKAPQFLRTAERFCKEAKAEYSDIRHLSSLLDVVKKFNEVMDHNKSVPDSQALVAQYLLLYSLSLPQGMEINDLMDVDQQRLRITGMVNIVDTSKDLEMIRWIEDWWAQTPYRAKVEGQAAMFAYMQHDVTATLINSIALAIGAVSLMMLLIFRSWRMLPLFVAPNVLPIALVVGVMGWLSIDIDLGVAVSGAIIIGVAVDDTIHFLVKYREARRQGKSLEEAFAYVMHYAGSAIVFTTLILSAAFAIFAFSDFVPNGNFGIVTATALMIALALDLLMLPAMLSLLDKGKKSLIA